MNPRAIMHSDRIITNLATLFSNERKLEINFKIFDLHEIGDIEEPNL